MDKSITLTNIGSNIISDNHTDKPKFNEVIPEDAATIKYQQGLITDEYELNEEIPKAAATIKYKHKQQKSDLIGEIYLIRLLIRPLK